MAHERVCECVRTQQNNGFPGDGPARGRGFSLHERQIAAFAQTPCIEKARYQGHAGDACKHKVTYGETAYDERNRGGEKMHEGEISNNVHEVHAGIELDPIEIKQGISRCAYCKTCDMQRAQPGEGRVGACGSHDKGKTCRAEYAGGPKWDLMRRKGRNARGEGCGSKEHRDAYNTRHPSACWNVLWACPLAHKEALQG